MPRASDGTVTLPAGNPVVAGSAAMAAIQNATNTDIATMLEDSLSRTGKGGMAFPMLFADGNSAAPGVAFTSEVTSGLFRQAASKIGMSVFSTVRMIWDSIANKVTAYGDVEVLEDVALNGGNLTVQKDVAVGGGLGVVGNLGVNGTATVTGTSTFTGRMTVGAGIAGILPSDLPAASAASYMVSGSSAGDAGTGITVIDVPNLFCNLTVASGGPVMVSVGSLGGATEGYINIHNPSNGNYAAWLRIWRSPFGLNSWTQISTHRYASVPIGATALEDWLQPGICILDTPGNGHWDYKVTEQVDPLTATAHMAVKYCNLFVHEVK